MKSPLRITYNCSNHNLPSFRFIEVKGVPVHRIADVKSFYEALGYTDAVLRSGVLPEEFIWDTYLRKGSDRTPACLEAKLIDYLVTHSEMFVEKFGREIEGWVHGCHGDRTTGSGCRAYCSPLRLVSAVAAPSAVA